MLAVFAKQMVEVALAIVATEVKADPVLEGTLLGQGLRSGGAFFEMEKSHLQTLVGSVSFLSDQ